MVRGKSDTLPDRSPIWVVPMFAGTILLGAFLLFQVQPLISKAILPWFGGATAVWTTCMLFFQVFLLGGYVYAHGIAGRLSPGGQAAVHAVLLVASLSLLPILPAAHWKPVDSDSPTWRVLVVLTASIGLPYFMLSTTSPLVQVWFSRIFPGRSPYRLYVLSNFGSLLALLSYPLAFEPALDLPVQSGLWSGAFALYAMLCVGCAMWAWRHGRAEPPVTEASQRVGWTRWTLWLLLPACASVVLLAATNHACQDVAVVPLLWVAPLAVYLLSLMVCFDHPRWYVRGLWSALAAIAVPLVACIDRLDTWFGYSVGFPVQLVACFSTLFFICMVCHGELVRLRPAPRYLTGFYLCIAGGGALGGVLVSLVAPAVFSTLLEWEIGLAASFLLALAVLVLAGGTPGSRASYNVVAVLVPPIVVIGVLFWQAAKIGPVESVRNFYGVLSVWETDLGDPQKHGFLLKHGRIIHGHQYADPPLRFIASMYYRSPSGIAEAIQYAGRGSRLRVGIVGLGAGTLAAYARPGDDYRFYEINPEVQRLAETWFTYLKDASDRGATWNVVTGDARLSLEREPPRGFNVLVLDAFNGDSIPTHLLTREAFVIYRRHLAPGGILAVHIVNQSLELAPVVGGLAEHFGLLASRVYHEGEENGIVYRTDWMLLSDREDFVRAVRPRPPPKVRDFSVPLWTDNNSNLFQILKRAR